MKTNRLKEMLRNGQQAVGCAISLGDSASAERLCKMGFDFVVIDTEHCPIAINQLETLLIAATPTESTLVVRSPWNDPVRVKRILDVGAEGVVIPWVNSREDAELAVSSCKYPPEGVRGCGPRRACFALADSVEDYLAHANEEVLLLGQIETVRAMSNLESILATEGLDGVMIGPTDLACSLGKKDDLKHDEVDEAIQTVLYTCREKDVPFGIFCGSPEMAKKWLDLGASLATVGSDVGFMLTAARSAMNAVGR